MSAKPSNFYEHPLSDKLFLSRETLYVAALVCVAAYFRIYNSGLTFFSFDQARDYWFGWQISQGALFPMKGPGQQLAFDLGPFFYYVTALPFTISNSLSTPYIQVGIGDTMSVVLCYLFARSYFGRSAALLGTALYAVSVQAVFVGRYPGNVGYVHFFVISYIWMFLRFLESGNRGHLIGASIFLGLALQFHSSVMLLIPLSAAMMWWRFREKAWWMAGLAALIIILAHFPLVISEFQAGFTNAKQAAGLVGQEVTAKQIDGYFSRLGGALILNSLVGSMLLPKKWSLWFQPFFLIQSGLYLFSAASAIFFLKKRYWSGRRKYAASFLIPWVLAPLFIFPIYPRVNHNYLDIIHPGVMILIGAVIVKLSNKVRYWVVASLAVVAAANLLFLIIMDEVQIKKSGFINLYRSSIIDMHNPAGSNTPFLTSVPAIFQVQANRALMSMFGSMENVLTHYHGEGRILFLDENKRFILTYLSQHNEGTNQRSDDHFCTVGVGEGERPQQQGDVHLTGPFYLRRVLGVRAAVGEIAATPTPTSAAVDYSVYSLAIPRSIYLKDKTAITIYPPKLTTPIPYRYSVLVSGATKNESALGISIQPVNHDRCPVEVRKFKSFFFVDGTLFRFPHSCSVVDPTIFFLETAGPQQIDVDVYGEMEREEH